jgi:hypothetical protein
MPLPTSTGSIIKQVSPRKAAGNPLNLKNRYAPLRDESPAPENGRGRSNSVKRKAQEGASYAEMAGGTTYYEVPVQQGETAITTLNTEIATVHSLCDKMVADVSNANVDPVLIPIFGTMSEAMKGILTVQKKLVDKLAQGGEDTLLCSNSVTNVPLNDFPRDLGAIPKKPRIEPVKTTRPPAPVHEGTSAAVMSGAGTGAGAGIGTGSANNAGMRAKFFVPMTQSRTMDREPEEDPVEKKFREAIKIAENSTLIFNLDLGRVPVMNKDTMNKRATASLLSMAAEKEKKTGSLPSDNTVEAIDDVLSLVKDVDFFGDTTKTYRNPKDKKNGSFCTVPVRYEFKDRDIRSKAESVLRKKCNVQCSTPYPAYIRESIRQIVSHVKYYYPDNYVRVNIDTNNMVFRVSRKPPDDAPSPGWKVRDEDIPIPREAMNVSAKWVPKEFKIDFDEEKQERTPYRSRTGRNREPGPVQDPDPDTGTSNRGAAPEPEKEPEPMQEGGDEAPPSQAK